MRLRRPTPGRCFAVVGAERALAIAQRAGADDATARAIAEGICQHITPGVGFERGPIGPMLSAGALLDLAHAVEHMGGDRHIAGGGARPGIRAHAHIR